LSGTIKKVADFLGHPIVEPSIPRLVDHLSIENFKHNPQINMDELKEAGVLNSGAQSFVRNGKTGGWNEEFTPELLERCKKWMAENLKDTDMRFPLKN
jgi:Sulfotransferase domain